MALALALGGCGARTGLELLDGDAGDPFDARSRPDGDEPRVTPDGGPPPPPGCALGCAFCRPEGEPVRLADRGQQPDVAWDGEKLLVVYDTAPGVTVEAVGLGGGIEWAEEIGGLQWARIAFDVEGATGMVVVDSGVQWLGADGRPTGEMVWLSSLGWQLRGDIAATSSGFLLMSGAGAYAEPPGLYFDRFGRAPGGLNLALLAPEGPRAPPEHAVDEDGRATLVASTTWDGSSGELYRAGAGGDPALIGEIGGPGGAVAGLAVGRDGETYLLLTREGWSLRIQWSLEDGGFGWIPLGESPRGASGHMIDVAGELVVASPILDAEDRVSVACVDPRRADPVGPPTVLATRTYSHSPRMDRTPRGYAVVWTETDDTGEGLIPMLQVMECCADE